MKNYKIFFFVLVSNKKVFHTNTQRAIEKLINKGANVNLEVTFNLENEFKNIRIWINFVLSTLYKSPDKYQDSKIIFIHQDVFLFEDFYEELQRMFQYSKPEKTPVFGFAGIDKNGTQYKFLKDSDVFSFTNFQSPQIVDSVDEFIFGIDANALIAQQFYLSTIGGWHAYAAEFSILFRLKGFETIVYPVYTEHNSVRNNNKGIHTTHKELFSIYKLKTNTLVGCISEKTNLEKFKISSYNFYVNNLKWKYKTSALDKFKSFLLDNLNVSYNKNRVFQEVIKSYKVVDLYVLKKKDSVMTDKKKIIVNTGTINLYFIDTIEIVERSKSKNSVVLGYNKALEGFKFLPKALLNTKKHCKTLFL